MFHTSKLGIVISLVEKGRCPFAHSGVCQITQNPDVDRIAPLYAEIQYVFVQFLTEHLTDCRRIFGGDLDAVMVLAILGQRYLSAHLAENSDPGPAGTAYSMSASRISDVTGMARETVRRKLVMMQRNGWIQQNADASWTISGDPGKTKVRSDLSELDQRGLARVLRFHADLGSVLAKMKMSNPR